MRRALYPDNIIVVSRKKAWGNLNRLLSCSVEAGQTQHVACSTRGMAWQHGIAFACQVPTFLQGVLDACPECISQILKSQSETLGNLSNI